MKEGTERTEGALAMLQWRLSKKAFWILDRDEGWNISWNEVAFAFHRLSSCTFKECTILCHYHNPCIFDVVRIFLKIVLIAVERTWKDSCGRRILQNIEGNRVQLKNWKYILKISILLLFQVLSGFHGTFWTLQLQLRICPITGLEGQHCMATCCLRYQMLISQLDCESLEIWSSFKQSLVPDCPDLEGQPLVICTRENFCSVHPST